MLVRPKKVASCRVVLAHDLGHVSSFQQWNCWVLSAFSAQMKPTPPWQSEQSLVFWWPCGELWFEQCFQLSRDHHGEGRRWKGSCFSFGKGKKSKLLYKSIWCQPEHLWMFLFLSALFFRCTCSKIESPQSFFRTCGGETSSDNVAFLAAVF